MGESRQQEGERIAKYLARAGVASRRAVERMIADGRITIDGAPATTPALKVTGGETIAVDGVDVAPPEAARLWRYHKKRGLITTHRDPGGRPTVFTALAALAEPALPKHLIAVGRLDMDSEGLLLLTNSGALARFMELPATGWTRRYRVRAHGRANDATLKQLARGITIDGVRYGPIEAMVERQQGANAWLRMALREGKNRELRKVLEHLGLRINRLIRVSHGPFQLGNLAAGTVREVPARVLREQAGAIIDKLEPPSRRTGPHAHRRRHP